MYSNILFIYCGGTIGLSKKNHILISNTFENRLRKKIPSIPFDFLELENIHESNDMESESWINIALKIKINYNKYDSFIILMGTDTMAFLSSALSFIMENLQKSVICTGSQKPLYMKDSDGVDNIINSIKYANQGIYKEVCICFNGKLFRGNRCTKIDNLQFNMFTSPNMKPLSEINQPLGNTKKDLIIFKNINISFLVFRITPNFDYNTLIDMIKMTLKLKIIILELFGLGTSQSDPNKLLTLINVCNEKNIFIVALTQNLKGGIIETYNITHLLKKKGILFGGDMTTEAGSTKICYLLGKYGNDKKKIIKLFNKNIRGELTE
jgi:L-asparaginase/Glu-tRNA(Gln) amidotransferase subunit D